MSSRMQLSPAELDRLEDALEHLESIPLPELDDDDPVGPLLSEYRELLQLSREAMPLEDVPAGLLDGVLEEARQAAANTAPRPAAPWWSRLRLGVWVPTLAFAGSAAVLLVLLWPAAEEDAAGDATVAQAEPEPEVQAATPAPALPAEGERRLADSLLEEPEPVRDAESFLPGQAARGGGLELGGVVGTETPEEDLAAEEREEADDSGTATVSKPRRARSSSGSSASSSSSPAKPTAKSKGSKSYDEPLPPPAPNAGPSSSGGASGKKVDTDSSLMREVLEGDKARQAGNCGLAKGIGALVGAVVAALGMSVVAVLVLRALGEWRQIEARERAGGS